MNERLSNCQLNSDCNRNILAAYGRDTHYNHNILFISLVFFSGTIAWCMEFRNALALVNNKNMILNINLYPLSLDD